MTSHDASDAAHLKALDDAMKDFKWTEEAAERGKEAMLAKYRQHGIDIQSGRAPSTPDIPPCDYCGTNWSGRLSCSRCKMVFYCSKECQKKAWKMPNGHKQECETIRQDSRTQVQTAVQKMKDSSLYPPPSRWLGMLRRTRALFNGDSRV